MTRECAWSLVSVYRASVSGWDHACSWSEWGAGAGGSAPERACVLLQGGEGENTRVCATEWECLGEWRSEDARAGSGRGGAGAGGGGARAAQAPVQPLAGFCLRGASRRRAFRIERSLSKPGAGRGAGTGAPSLGRGQRGGHRCSVGGEEGESLAPLRGKRGRDGLALGRRRLCGARRLEAAFSSQANGVNERFINPCVERGGESWVSSD